MYVILTTLVCWMGAKSVNAFYVMNLLKCLIEKVLDEWMNN